MPFLGCHVSISGGIANAPVRGAELGCEAIQVFTSNQLQWHGSPISTAQAELFKTELAARGIIRVVAHAGYLINLASPEPGKLAKSRQALIEEIERCQLLGIEMLIVHPGSHRGGGIDQGLSTVARSLDYAFEAVPNSRLRILLETTAGQGSNLGDRFEHFSTIITRCNNPERLGVCFDTCHAFAAGYDLIMRRAYEKTWRWFAQVVGLERLYCIHLNDSRRECGSRIDRHANLGEGYLGWRVFERIVRDRRFAELPLIIETPGGDENMAREICRLKSVM